MPKEKKEVKKNGSKPDVVQILTIISDELEELKRKVSKISGRM